MGQKVHFQGWAPGPPSQDVNEAKGEGMSVRDIKRGGNSFLFGGPLFNPLLFWVGLNLRHGQGWVSGGGDVVGRPVVRRVHMWHLQFPSGMGGMRQCMLGFNQWCPNRGLHYPN